MNRKRPKGARAASPPTLTVSIDGQQPKRLFRNCTKLLANCRKVEERSRSSDCPADLENPWERSVCYMPVPCRLRLFHQRGDRFGPCRNRHRYRANQRACNPRPDVVQGKIETLLLFLRLRWEANSERPASSAAVSRAEGPLISPLARDA